MSLDIFSTIIINNKENMYLHLFIPCIVHLLNATHHSNHIIFNNSTPGGWYKVAYLMPVVEPRFKPRQPSSILITN